MTIWYRNVLFLDGGLTMVCVSIHKRAVIICSKIGASRELVKVTGL